MSIRLQTVQSLRAGLVLSAVVGLVSLLSARAEDDTPVKKPEPAYWSVAPLLPPDTLLLVTAPDVQKLTVKLKQTGMWRIISNQDLQNAFQMPLLQARAGMAFAEGQLGLRLSELLSLFSQGEITFAVLAVDKTNVDGRPLPDLLLSVQARDKSAALVDELNKRIDQLNALAQGALQITQTPVGDTAVKTIIVPGQLAVLQYAVCDGTVLVTMGEGRIEKVLAMREKLKVSGGKLPEGAAPEVVSQIASFKKTAEKAGPDTDLMIFLNVDALLKNQLLDLRPKNGAEKLVWDALSLNGIRAVSYSAGIRDKGIRELLYVDQPVAARKGLLALLDGAGLDAETLSAAPKNAIAALAVKIAAEKTFDGLIELALLENPNAKDDINAWLQAKGQELGLDIRREVFSALTGQAVFSLSIPARHPKAAVGFPQPLLSLSIKDVAALKNVLTALRNAGRDQVEITQVLDGANDIVVVREKFPQGRQAAQICYVIDRNDLIVSLFPLALREELRRRAALAKAAGAPADTLAEDLDFKAARSQLTGSPRAMAYLDTGALVVALYDSLIPLAQMMPSHPQINVATLPTSDLFMQNLGGTVFGLTTDADGLAAEGYSATGVVSFMAVAIPALFQARRAAFMAGQRDMRDRQETMTTVADALQRYAKDNGGNLPGTLQELQPKYLNDLKDADQLVYLGKQAAPNRVVAHSSEKARGPITLLLQDGSVVRVGRGQFPKALRDGYTPDPGDKPVGPGKDAVAPPRPPDTNF